MSFTTISVIGLGYIELSAAAAFASRQKYVIGVDVNQRAVNTVNRDRIHIVKPNLSAVVKMAVGNGFLRTIITPVDTDVYLITVSAPFEGEHESDMIYVGAVTKSLAPVLKKGVSVVLELASSIEATEQMATWLAEMRPDLAFP